MNEQQIFDAVQNIFRDNFDDDSLVLTRETTADDIEDWDSLEQINLLTAMEKQSACGADARGFFPFCTVSRGGHCARPVFTSRPTARRTDGGIFL